jgi:hypothetical protein
MRKGRNSLISDGTLIPLRLSIRWLSAISAENCGSSSLRAEQFRTTTTVLCGSELAPNFPLFNQQVAPLTFIAEFRAPHAPAK